MEITGKSVNTLNSFINQCKDIDDGKTGKAFEVAIREYVQPRSKRNGHVTPARAQYGDMRKGNRINFEIKSACGELGIIPSTEEKETEETDVEDVINYILPKATYIIYCPEVDITIPPEKQAFVFSRQEFLEMVNNYTGSGKILRVKTSTNGKKVISFQSFYSQTRQKSSKKIADFLWDECYNHPTVEQFFNKKKEEKNV